MVNRPMSSAFCCRCLFRWILPKWLEYVHRSIKSVGGYLVCEIEKDEEAAQGRVELDRHVIQRAVTTFVEGN